MAGRVGEPSCSVSPSAGLAPATGDTIIRAMTPADTAFDRQLFDEDRGAQFLPLGLDGAMLTMLLDQQFRAQQQGTRTDFPDAAHFIVVQAGQSVGRLTTALTGDGGSLSLHVIAIVLSASSRGRGIGTDVINRLDEMALAQGATRLTLSVLRNNDGARRLYERLGFRAAADDGAAMHLAMVKPLASGDTSTTAARFETR